MSQEVLSLFEVIKIVYRRVEFVYRGFNGLSVEVIVSHHFLYYFIPWLGMKLLKHHKGEAKSQNFKDTVS